MTNYEIIKAACIKANPKLMELTVGCMLKRNFQIPFLGEELIFFVDKDEFGRFKGITGEKYCVFTLKECEILGHEPQLSDVLLALNKLQILGFIQPSGYFAVEGYSTAKCPHYDLTKSVKEQSPEVLQFLADLL